MKKIHIDIQPKEESFCSPDRPLIISGPCSAETEEQVLQTARAIVTETPEVSLFRAGIWKPRTRPGSFEGIGTPALRWMQRVKKETGLRTTIEVGSAHHVEQALAHEIDVLWLGARTTVNPFSVSEIAEALRGVDIPVFVKNPLNPDLQLWVGALERLNSVGLRQLAAIHRGFSVGEHKKFRNPPHWQIPIQLKMTVPELPLICDPSHICGQRDTLAEIAQKAMDLGMDGLMIETHPDPGNALSDQDQQLTPGDLKVLISRLRTRRMHDLASNADHKLGLFRDEIDEIDNDLLYTLSRRFRVLEDIARIKKDHDMQILQPERWNQLINNIGRMAEELDLDAQVVQEIYKQIHHQSMRYQATVMR
ncbi:MAG: chorismate mutase [Saprospiraceae bacterium]|nr:chorismate mutase [Saprospiraceae bacterium]